MKHPTEDKVTNSYVHNRPMMCKRKDIGSKELVGMRFHEDDMDLINKISKRNPEYTPTFNNKKITDGPIKPTRTGYCNY